MRAGDFAAVVLTVLAAAAPEAARAEENDLREFRIGMAVSDLPPSGYTGFRCAGEKGQTLSGWQDYAQCPADTAGRHAVRFRYDENANPMSKVNDAYEGTKVGGHPVVLSLLVGNEGRVDGLVIDTDPSARLYMRKKAFLFGDLAKARYGSDGWTCSEGEPTGDEAPVGGVFIREHCTKATPSRLLTLDRELFRRPSQDFKDFVSHSRLEIREAG